MSDDILQQQNKVSKKSIEFEQIFETFLVHIIFNYFLHNGQYSNQVPELCNLMLCNRSTNESMTVRFLKHGKFNMSNFKFWEKDKIRLLRNIWPSASSVVTIPSCVTAAHQYAYPVPSHGKPRPNQLPSPSPHQRNKRSEVSMRN